MQHRYRTHAVTLSSIFLGLLVAAPAGAASLTKVSDWGKSGVPSYVEMYIYVPDKLAAKPPIMVSAHSCGSTATGQMGNIPKIKAAADANGFILILPDNPGRNCWDVGAPNSLKHDGGGDTQAVAQMVKYALSKYNGDASRVYAMGGSSGGMMTQALMAVYPDVFRAGAARAGVPAGCWADGYDSGQQWSNTCANGSVSKTAQQWGDLARSMDSSYTGHRPRIQLIQGDADERISYKNMAEAIKQWTNVLALSTAPASNDMFKGQVATYTRQFWKNACDYTVLETWAGHGGGHSMGYEEDAILKFFGLDVAGGSDPEPECPAGGNTGSAGASGTAGGTGSSGSPGTGSGGASTAVGVGGSTSTAASGGSGPGVVVGSGGSGSGTVGAGGTSTGAPGSVANGGSSMPAGTSGGAAALGTAGPAADSSDSGGCAVVSGTSKSKPTYGVIALGLTLLAFRRRRRSAQR